MARSRNIKPGFFTNDELAECGPLGMLLFAGLWTIADREGRLEDRPKRIKAQILPYFDADADELLNALAERGFIERYEVAGQRYLHITKFLEHQNPHIKEAPSTMPAPDSHQEVLDQAGADVPPARLVTVEKCDEINTSDEHQTSTVLSRLIPDSSPLIPDTGFPNTPQPPRRGGVRVQYPPEFEEFWAEVERKEPSKAKALDSWQRARRKASAEDILAGLRRWLPVWAVTEPDKVPYITTWLNQERWTVEKPVPPSNGRHPPPRQPSNPGTYFDLGERYERQGL